MWQEQTLKVVLLVLSTVAALAFAWSFRPRRDGYRSGSGWREGEPLDLRQPRDLMVAVLIAVVTIAGAVLFGSFFVARFF